MLTTIRQIRDVISTDSRRKVWLLLGLMAAGTLLESISVGAVVPAFGILADPGWIARHPQWRSAFEWTGAESPERLAVWAMLALVAVYTLKTAFSAILAYAETGFAYATQADISNRLYACYMRQPWTFHLQRNSAELIRNATAEPQLFALYLLAVLRLCSEGLVLLALTTVLVVVEPLGALVATSAIGGAAVLFQALTRRRVREWGVQRQVLEAARLKQLQQGLGGAKEVKLLGREPYFERLFAQHNRGFADTLRHQQFLDQLPRLWLEAVAVSGIALLVIVLVARDGSFLASLPVLGLFAAAAFRLLPSLNRIVGAMQAMRFRAPSLHVLHRELELAAEAGVRGSTSARLGVSRISLDQVCYRYPGTKLEVLRNITLTIDAGTTVGFIGASGAGKSTLVDVILGLLPPSSGAVQVNGSDVRNDLRGWQSSVGYVPQSIYLVDDSIRRNVAFGLPDAEIDDERIWHVLGDARLDDLVRSLPEGLGTMTGERGVRLSGGQRQRIGIARALYHDPDVLVLDEATSALDGATESEVMQAVGALHGRKTVIIVTHRLTTIAGCDRVFELRGGEADASGARRGK